MTIARPKIKVAVLGGGCGAMAAAWELTSTPALRDRFEVTVYTHGWRLGGKGASGRNAQFGQRIEEHGLHAFLGFYETAFGVLRGAYAEWKKAPDNPFKTWEDAFKPQYRITMMEHLPDGRWTPWNIDMPKLPGLPGDEFLRGDRPGDQTGATRQARRLSKIVLELLDWLAEKHGELAEKDDELKTSPELRTSTRSGLELASRTWRAVERGSRPHDERAHGDFVEALAKFQRGVQARKIPPGSKDEPDWLRRLRTLLDLGAAIGMGLMKDVLPPFGEGFASINHLDLKDWLMKHGASRDTAWSPLIRGLYDMGFAFARGDASKMENGQSAAGVALWVLLQMGLGYKGAPLWKMQAGMGDTVFSPLHEVLKQRGVAFEFFTRVTNLALSRSGNLVERIDLLRQAEVKGGRQNYRPLIDVNGVASWPSEPDWDQLEDGNALRGARFESQWETRGKPDALHLGKDYDLIVLGLSVGALPFVGKELLAESPRWAEMARTTKTIQTQAFQLWLTPPVEALGWPGGTTIMTGYAEPFDSWGEMSHLVPREPWPKEHQPGSIEYFCSPMLGPDEIPIGDPDYPAKEKARVKELVRAWLEQYAGTLWPNTIRRDGGFDYALLVDLLDRRGPDRLDGQFWRANVDPTERYVLSLPGTIAERIDPEDSGFLNLVPAGDWTRSSLDAGSAEAAFDSGVRAARGLIARARP